MESLIRREGPAPWTTVFRRSRNVCSWNGERLEPLSAARLERAKHAFSSRNIPQSEMLQLITSGRQPAAGDLVLARVDHLRQQGRIELTNGRRVRLEEGDEVLVCFGHRHVADQFESIIPRSLGSCQLVASGGLAARMRCLSAGSTPATELTTLGLVADSLGRTLTLQDFSLPLARDARRRPFAFAVVGTARHSGKTATAARLIRGLTRAGLRVGAAQVNGASSGCGPRLFTDAGATTVLDFTDLGYPSSYDLDEDRVQELLEDLMNHLAAASVDTVVLEVADGLAQGDTAALVSSMTFAARVDAILLAAEDGRGARAGTDWLLERGLPLIGLTGAASRSLALEGPGAMINGVPALSRVELTTPSTFASLVSSKS